MDRSNGLLVRTSFLLTLPAISCACLGQTAMAPATVSAGYTSPFPLRVAPGQLVTMYLQGPAAASVSAVFWNQQKVETVPVLQVSPWYAVCVAPPGSTGYLGVQAQPDHVHILTSCDTVVGGESGSESCAPLILHADGQPVSYQNPASGGEELVAYATGLGQTNPPLTTGVPATQDSPAISTFNLDFNYRPNALATQPATGYPPSNPPVFAGSTQGFIGLYQINFVVPPPPADLEPCSNLNFIAAGPVAGLVLSNFTVSIGSLVSFDGAGICVTPGS